MNIFSKKLIGGIAAIILAAGINSCVKQEFDEPPTGGTDPVVDGIYITIAELKALYVANTFTPVSKNYYIKGVVIGDDQSGNFYKEMVVQDSTGGISVLLDMSNYYTDFPIGRRVFIKVQGLYMYSYNGLIELGASIDNSGSYPSLARIPASLVSKYVLKGSYYHKVVPKEITLSDLVSQTLTFPQNTLVTIPGVQFTASDTSLTWADADGLNDRSTSIEDCNHIPLVVRTSGYSDFAGKRVPVKNGSITGVIQIYLGSLQLKIRDLSDAGMSGARCGEITGICTYNDTSTFIPISYLRLWASFGNATAPDSSVIKGVVVSDIANLNFDNRNMFIQDSTGGIVVRFKNVISHGFPLGSLVRVVVSNQELSEFNGLLEVNDVDLVNASPFGTCVEMPVTVTIGQINTSLDTYESRLVRINDVVFSGTGDTYTDAATISDATGTMTIFTRSSSTFGYENYPAGHVAYILGVVTDYMGPEFCLRNVADVHP